MLGTHPSIETKIKMSISQKKIGNKPPPKSLIPYTRERRIKFQREFRDKNRDKVREYGRVYRNLRKCAGPFSGKIIQMVYEDNIKKYGTLTCYLCNNSIEFGKDHLEHKTPLSRGGDNQYSNLGVSCAPCNFRKHDKTVEEFTKTGRVNETYILSSI